MKTSEHTSHAICIFYSSLLVATSGILARNGILKETSNDVMSSLDDVSGVESLVTLPS